MKSDHGPAQEEVAGLLRDIGHTIGHAIDASMVRTGEKWGFALLIFRMGDNRPGDRMNYLSNARREDMLAAMKEFIAHAEGRYYGDPTRKQ